MDMTPSEAVAATSEKVSVYIDGFNLYFGMKQSGFRRFYWLDIHKLAMSFLKPDQRLIDVKYFTARISGPEDKRIRQNTFLEAVATLAGVTVFEGQFISKEMRCRSCSFRWDSHEEKMTDVNIATEMLMDAVAGRFDRAILVSADSDLVPPVRALRGPVLKREVIVALPPARTSIALKKEATGHFQISSSRLSQCQLADQVTKPGGFVLHRPPSWK